MQRITISIDDELAMAFDRFIEQRGYGNRSEAVRDLIRDRLDDSSNTATSEGHCVASLSYVYDHHERALAERIAAAQHAHHDLTVASMHVHLDHHNCLETVVLQGTTVAVRDFAAQLTAAPGVRHGALNLVGVETAEPHSHGGRHGAAAHRHLKPKF
jgi:CopG family transcriptional regulator, nickel-responsive regulator